MTTVATTKAKETEFGRVIQYFMYAACVDIERDLYNESRFDKYLYYSFETINKDKKERPEGLKHRFTVADGSKQLLTHIFNKFIEELSTLAIGPNDSFASLAEASVDAIGDSYLDEIAKLNAITKHGATLTAARDASEWFRGQILANLKQYASNDKIISMLYVEFTTYLKSIALILTKQWWHSQNPLAGILYSHGMNADMISDLTGNIRPKPPSKPKTKKTTAVVDATTTDVNITDSVSTVTDSALTSTTDVTPVIDTTQLQELLNLI